jgi:type 1 glutamine amidotransferase
MMRLALSLFVSMALICGSAVTFGQATPFHVLAFYSTDVEADHVAFAEQAIRFYSGIADRDHFSFTSTTRWGDLNPEALRKYQVVMWLNNSPSDPEQRAAFQSYMEHGGAWIGFHASGYNDKDTNWPWFVSFLGGTVFYGNSWPPLPARLRVDDKSHPIAAHLAGSLESPANEWYSWQPSPRQNPDVKILLTLDPSNYPLGLKDTLTGGDVPVVWTNTKFRMVYMNMGHGDKIFSDQTQNLMFEDAVLWLGDRQ